MEHLFNYIVYDIETSGLSPKKAIIMEIALIVLDHNLKEKERHNFYVKPYGENPEYQEGALNTHNIPIQKTIDEGIEAKDVVNMITNIFKKYSNGARKKPILSGHNIKKFDNSFMIALFDIFKKDFTGLYEMDLDTLDLAHIKYGYTDEMVNFKLGSCCSREDISILDAHRAMADTEANAKLLIKYLTDLRTDSANVSGIEEKRSRDTFHF